MERSRGGGLRVHRQYGNMAGITVRRVYSREKIKESKWREGGKDTEKKKWEHRVKEKCQKNILV